MRPPDGIDGVSSTAVREHLFDPAAVAAMLHPAVLPLVRQLEKEDFPEEILSFRDEYAFLGNAAEHRRCAADQRRQGEKGYLLGREHRHLGR